MNLRSKWKENLPSSTMLLPQSVVTPTILTLTTWVTVWSLLQGHKGSFMIVVKVTEQFLCGSLMILRCSHRVIPNVGSGKLRRQS